MRFRSPFLAGVSALALAAVSADPGHASRDASGSARTGVATELVGAVGSTETVIDLTFAGKTLETIKLAHGQRVRLLIRTHESMELHFHGYDLVAHSSPGKPAVFAFVARHAGRFSIGLHGKKDFLGRLEKSLIYVEVRPE